MSVRLAKLFCALLALMAVLPTSASAQQARSIVTTQDGDYFGFDLRTERNVSLDRCEAVCLADQQCRAFTYNMRAQWCFLKSDYSLLKPFAGAVAGKVVNLAGEPDIGAPEALAFLPDHINTAARRYRETLLAVTPQEDIGIVHLSAAGSGAMMAGNARDAASSYAAALAISPDDVELWIELARAKFSTEPINGNDRTTLTSDGLSSALNAYLLTRGASPRARSLAAIGLGLDRRDLGRPAIQAYEASLALVNDAEVRAAYLDVKARKGFRVVDHSIDADLAAPRVCVQFSEDLAKAGIDYMPFITVDGAAPAAIETNARQLCVEGLEHGKKYRITIRQGLPAAIGEVIETPIALNVYVRDRAPSIRFSGENFVLPAQGRQAIPMVSVNTPSADLKLFRIGDRALTDIMSSDQFLRQLDNWSISQVRDDLGQVLWEGEIEIASQLNQEVVTSFPVDEVLQEREPGVYLMTAIPEGDQSEYWNAKATQWFVVSDIGLSTYAGEDGLTVFARSLADAKPIVGVELELLARNNEVLGTATTDAAGRATFTPGLSRGTGGMAPAVLTAKSGSADFVFLDMSRAGFDLSDRGVTGRTAPGAIDIYTWTERGIYRAGETVHAAALARDDRADAIENLPLTFIFTRPDGVEDSRIVSDGRALGGHHAPMTLQQTAMRGTWNVRVHVDPKADAVASTSFLVEDFVPDRIEFDLDPASSEIVPGEPAEIAVEGRYLYGAPGAGLQLEGDVTVDATREWDRYDGYKFGLSDEEIETGLSKPLDALMPTNEEGKATITVAVDELPSTTRLLDAKVTVRMREGGGRAVERATTLKIRPQDTVIGIRPDFRGEEVAENSTAGFRVIAVSPDGSRQALPEAQWTLTKIERNYQWYRSNDSWNYEAVTTERQIAEGTVEVSSADPAAISVNVDWGRYRLDVETADPIGPAASMEFDAGWFVEATSTETPDGLEIALDKASYKVGETAKLKVSPRFAGELLVAVGSERLLATFDASVPAEGREIDIPVSGDWGGGSYVTATLFRPGDGEQSRMPARAIGIKWLSIDPEEKRLDVNLGTAERSDPHTKLSVPVMLAGLTPGEDAYVMVSAVDVGILNLTSYKAPHPQDWYFGQRRLGLEMRDLYGQLIDGSAGAFGRIRTGGDGGGMAIQGSPPTEKLVAFFSGPVRVDADGKAQVDFEIPEFNGTARVMAVAWSKTAIGQASADVIIRDPIVVTAGQPRFLATGDQASIRLDIHNTDGPSGDYTLGVALDGTASFDLGDVQPLVRLDAGERTTVILPITATGTGSSMMTVSLSQADGPEVKRTLFIPVRPPAMPLTTQQVVSLGPEGGSIRVDRELLAASLLDGASVTLGVSPTSAFDLPSMLMTLDRYPYGCAEQTISRALPLMYVSEFSDATGLEDDPGLRQRVQEAIDRVLTFQSSSGSYGLWGPGYGDMWLDSYVTDFLTRAREQDYVVPVQAMQNALDNLQNQLSYTTDVQERGTEIAYALYVLARNRKASVGDLRYYADTRLEEFSSPMARAQVAASLALYGDNQRADRAFASSLRQVQGNVDGNFYRTDYGSNLRDGAAILALAAETSPAPASIPAMIRYVSEERGKRRYTSTQEEAWMVLAARALRSAGEAIRLTVNGVPHEGNLALRLDGSELQASPITVANVGTDAVDAVITTVAAPAEPPPAGGDGFEIERTYYTLDGNEANITEAMQNDRYVVVLRVNELNDWPSRVAVTDLLPAGFEIDNPRVVGSADLSNFDWLGDPAAVHTEFRNDRFVAAFDREGGGAFTVAYVVRAVTPGIYSHPAAVVEDMYRPQFHAHTAAGVMEVSAAQ